MISSLLTYSALSFPYGFFSMGFYVNLDFGFYCFSYTIR
jgi:hypothetical protein